MKKYKLFVFIFWFAILLNSWAKADILNNILEGVFRQQDLIEEQIKDAIFLGRFSYVEINAKGDTVKTINSLRRIYSKGSDKQKSEYLEMTIDGKKLTEPEIKKHTKNNQSNENFKSPFYKRFRNDYDFVYRGEDPNAKVWIIGFNPKQKGKGYMKGTAQISQIDFSIKQMQFLPTDLPFVVKNFNITLDYAKFENYSLPSKFTLEMEIQVKVVLNFAHKFIKMQELYSEYQFNNNLPDSIFGL